MIGKLRKKFIVAAIAAVFLVLLVLIGSINALSFRGLVSDADATLRILAENKGAFPRQMLREQDRPSDPQGPPDGENGAPLGERRGGNGELAYQSRFFTAWFSADGSLTRVNLDSLASLTQEEASALAESVYASGRTKGFEDE